jgi:AsmA protein
MKPWVKILIAAAIVIVVVIALIPLFVNANTFRPMIEKKLSDATGRKVTLGGLSLSMLHGRLTARDLSISGDPAFSTTPILTASELRIGVAMKPLIFGHQLNVRSFTVIDPQINVIRAANGTWNFSTIGNPVVEKPGETGGAPPAAANPSGKAPALPPLPKNLPELNVGLIEIENAKVSVEMLPAHGGPSVYTDVNLTAHDFSFNSKFPFELSAGLPAGGSLNVTGHIGPLNRSDTATSPADVHVSVKDLNPVAAGFLNPSAGISVVTDIDTDAKSDGTQLVVNGSAHLVGLKLRKSPAAAQNPVDVSFFITHQLKENTGVIKDAAVKIGNSALHVSGTYLPVEHGADDPMLALKMVGQNLPVNDLQDLMTAIGIRLPNNSKLHDGTVSLSLAINGQAKALAIIGPVAADNTKLVGFDVGSKIKGIAALSGVKTGDTSEFQKLRANVKMNDAGVRIGDIDAVIVGMGELNGSGTVSPANQLDFNLTVQVANAGGVGKIGVGLLTALNGHGENGAKGVPLKVVGTPDEPVITADVGGIVGKKTKSLLGVFHKKKD